jgi:hypothetical protein
MGMDGTHIFLAKLNHRDDCEDLYGRISALRWHITNQPLVVDLGSVPFVPVDGLVALACSARLWHRWTEQKLVLRHIQPQVHRYFERMNLFSQCGTWIHQDRQLDELELFERKPDSERLLELTPIACDEEQNADDVQMAVDRIHRILTNLVYRDALSVGQLCTMLSEIAQNVVHSLDLGFAIVQRYRENASPSASMGHRVIINVADLGVGIEGSLGGSQSGLTAAVRAQLTSGSDYILKALELGITSRRTAGGMGLHQVRSIVNDWEGTLVIRSRCSLVQIARDTITCRDNLVEVPGTQVTISVRG